MSGWGSGKSGGAGVTVSPENSSIMNIPDNRRKELPAFGFEEPAGGLSR